MISCIKKAKADPSHRKRLEDAAKPQVKYDYNIQSGKRTKSFGIASTDFIGIINASDRKKMIDASKSYLPSTLPDVCSGIGGETGVEGSC